MARQTLTASARTEFKKSFTKTLRKDGLIPGTVYGSHLSEAVSVAVRLDELTGCLTTGGGANVVIDLTIDGRAGQAVPVVVNNVQRDARTRKVLHVDFHAVSMDQKITATVPVRILGEAIGVKQEGAAVENIHRELTVHALPDSIPAHIDIDISHLHAGESVKIGDLPPIEGVEIEGPVDDPIVMVRVKHAVAEEAKEAEEVGEAVESSASAEAAEAGTEE